MVRTTDGFEIAEVDLKLRGPGDLMGTQQSGMLELKIADIIKDNAILQYARQLALTFLEEDPELKLPKTNLYLAIIKRLATNNLNGVEYLSIISYISPHSFSYFCHNNYT